MSNAFLGIYNREMKSENRFSLAMASQPLEVVEWLSLSLSLSLKKFRIVLVPVCVQIGSGGVVAVVTWGPLTC